jgi:GT2 family glycosyltransferase
MLRPGGSADLNLRGTVAPASPSSPAGLDAENVLLAELESLEWRIGQLEAVFARLMRVGIRAIRLYRKLGHMLLKTPLAGACRKLMGQIAPEERYRRWLMVHRATDPYTTSTVTVDAVPDRGPLISIVMPVFRPNLPWLKDAVDSVRTQSYGRWQLLIVLDGGPDAEVLDYLESLATEESRIQCIFSDRGGISSTLNQGLMASSGTYVAFIDQDDMLEGTALSHIAAATLCDQPDILFTDEDYVDKDGRAQVPIFKPAWSPALLLSCMYLGHLLVVHTERAKAIGGFRSACDGAQDYDLALRLTDPDAHVVHIPRVLYHLRQHAGSTALHPDAKPYSHLAGRRALEETMKRRGLNAAVQDGLVANSYRLSYSFSSEDSAAIIIPTRSPKLLSRFFASLDSVQDKLRREVHVIVHCQDGQADSEITAIAERFGARVIEYRGPFNFSLMNNLAASGVRNSYLVFVNDDVLVRSDRWLDDLCAPFLRAEVGIVGAQLHYPDGSIQHSGIVTGMGDGVGHAGRFQFGSPFWTWLGLTRNVSAVTGACLAVRRTLFEQVGGFDTRYFNNYNDVDLCLRAQSAGFEVVLSCGAHLIHDEGRTRLTGTGLRERMAIWTQWGGVLAQTDDFYSPNLSRRLEIIDLAPPASQ